MDVVSRDVELLVVGAGPAGVACALQASRDNIDTLLVGGEPVGGLLPAARRIDNLPGFPAGISGPHLAHLLSEQLDRNNVRAARSRIQRLQRTEGFFRATFESGELDARAVVLATGTSPAHFAVSGLDRLAACGRLHRDARTFPANTSGSRALVIGGGDAALDTALNFHDRGAKVTIALRGDRPRACHALRVQLEATDIELLSRHQLVNLAAREDGGVATLQLHTGTERDLWIDQLAVCVGRRPCTELLKGLPVTAAGRIRTDVPGLFLAGDIIRGNQRFVATAQGDGQRAAQLAIAYLAAQR